MSASRKLNDPVEAPTTLLVVAPALTGVVTGVSVDVALGRVLNVNLLGNQTKICSFDCVYCNLGATTIRLNQIKKDANLPTVEQVVNEVRFHIANAIGADADYEYICLTGNGEPTLHPEFVEIVHALLELKRTAAPTRKLAVRTNGSTLDARKTLEAINLLDDRVVKLDVGNDRLFKAFNGPLTRKTLTRLISDIRGLRDVVIETVLLKGVGDNTDATDIEDWIEAVAMTQPKRVHLRTISSTIPHPRGIEGCDEDMLYMIASRLERKTQIRATVSGLP